MKIEIIQKGFTLFQNKYEILINGRKVYKAKNKLFSFKPTIDIIDNHGDIVCSILGKTFSNRNFPSFSVEKFGTNFTIKTLNVNDYELKTGNQTISFFEQEGRYIGIFIKEEQVGIISKNKKSYGGGDKYKALYKETIIKPLPVICFIIGYDFYKKDDDSISIVNVDYGNIYIKPTKKVDLNWKP